MVLWPGCILYALTHSHGEFQPRSYLVDNVASLFMSYEEPWFGSRCVCTCHGSIEAHCHQQRDGGGRSGDPCFYLRLLLQHLAAFGSLEGQIDSAWAFCVCWRWPQLDLIKSGWNPEAFKLKASSVLSKHILERDKQICIPDQQGFVLILAMQIRNKHFPLHLR